MDAETDAKIQKVMRTEIANATLRTWSGAQSNQEQVSYDIERLITEHTITKDDVDYLISWEVLDQGDSTVTVAASISTDGNKLTNRIGSMFYATQIKREGELIVKDFYHKLVEHLKKVGHAHRMGLRAKTFVGVGSRHRVTG